jgi:hypothetical protein
MRYAQCISQWCFAPGAVIHLALFSTLFCCKCLIIRSTSSSNQNIAMPLVPKLDFEALALDDKVTLPSSLVTLPVSAFRYISDNKTFYASVSSLSIRYSQARSGLGREFLIYNPVSRMCRHFVCIGTKTTKDERTYVHYKSDDGLYVRVYWN